MLEGEKSAFIGSLKYDLDHEVYISSISNSHVTIN